MNNRDRGTTLSELLITLAVISTLAGAGAHSLVQALPNYRLGGAARSLLMNIHRTKLQAVQRGCAFYLDFDMDNDGRLDKGHCFLWEDRNDNFHKDHLEKAEPVFDLKLPAGVCLGAYPKDLGGPRRGPNNTRVAAGGGDGITFRSNRIRFNPNGTCTAGTIYLHSSRGRTFALRLRSNGLAQLWRHDGDQWQR